MRAIRTLNIAWERRFRGGYPVSRYALSDAPEIALAVPRPLEPRAYDLTRFTVEGEPNVRTSFTVETLMKLDTSPAADSLVGMTADDVYLFQPGSKLRYLPDRRITYVDAAMSRDGRRLAVVYSDLAGSSFELTFGGIDGHVFWTRDVDHPISAVTISPDGGRIALGCEDGTILLIDAQRRDVWRFEQPAPIRALAASENGDRILHGAANGTIGLIDQTGARRWECHIDGAAVAVALNDDGAFGAALTSAGPSSTLLTCLLDDGTARWDHEADQLLTGLWISPSGEFVATGGRDGLATIYHVVPAEGEAGDATTLNVATLLGRADELASSGDFAAACIAARAARDQAPVNVDTFDAWVRARERFRSGALARYTSASEAGDLAAALDAVDALLRVEPDDREALTIVNDVRERRVDQLVSTSAEFEKHGELEAADSSLREAVALAPLRRELRVKLGELRIGRATKIVEEADSRLAAGAVEAAVGGYEQACALAPSMALSAKLETARTSLEFAEGMALYSAKRYREAAFQFRKTLARDPGHRDALRHLNFALKFDQDAATAELANQFGKLE